MNIKNIGLTKKFVFFGSTVALFSILLTVLSCIWVIRNDFVNKASIELDNRLKVFWELILSKDPNLLNSKMRLDEKIKNSDIRIEDNKLIVGSYVLNDDEKIVDRIKEIFGGTATIFMRDVRVSTNVIGENGSRALGTKLQGVAYDAVFNKMVSYRGEATILGKEYFTAYDPIKNKAGEIIGVLYVGVPKSDYFSALSNIIITVIIIAIILVFIINVIIYFFTKKLLMPILKLVPVANSIAEGNLNIKIEVDRDDEIGQLLASMRNMVDKWKNIAAGIVSEIKHISSLAGQKLNAAASLMNDSALDQSKKAQQVATAARQMSQTVVDITKNLNGIAESASETVNLAKNGELVVEKSVKEVQEIEQTVNKLASFVSSLEDRSKQIGKIVTVINDIADQTNLVALNAAIEAARAGEQGRGFAVVADEVRKLAEKTAISTMDIENMIKVIRDEAYKASEAMEKTIEKVSLGVKFSSNAGESLKTIVKKVEDLQIMVQQIASATVEMSAASEEITKDIEQIALGTKQTLVCSEETRDSSTEISRLSSELQKMVSVFKV